MAPFSTNVQVSTARQLRNEIHWLQWSPCLLPYNSVLCGTSLLLTFRACCSHWILILATFKKECKNRMEQYIGTGHIEFAVWTVRETVSETKAVSSSIGWVPSTWRYHLLSERPLSSSLQPHLISQSLLCQTPVAIQSSAVGCNIPVLHQDLQGRWIYIACWLLP